MPLSRTEKLELLELGAERERRHARRSMLAFATRTKPDYETNWHHGTLCEYLDRFARGEIKRLIVTMPPRHGKSELVSRRLPAYILGHDPDAPVIACSYGADLAQRMNRDVQRIMDSPSYWELFPETRLGGKNIRAVASGSWLRNSDIFEVVGRRGIYRSAGVGGAITGMGMKFGIIDDPIKNQKEADSPVFRRNLWDWYGSTFLTRLEKDGSILITMTRWHEDDLVGRLLDQAKADPEADQWTILNLEAVRELAVNPDDPRAMGEALWPNKYSEQRMRAIKATVGPQLWNSLYQQRPSTPEGNSLKRAWWKYWKVLPARFDQMILSVDLSFDEGDTADFAVFQCWGKLGADRYLIDQVKGQMDFTEQVMAFEAFAGKHKGAMEKIVEKKANGAALISTLKRKIPGLIPYNPQTSKELRVKAISPQVQAGNVWLPHASVASWVGDLVEESAAFPKGLNDDQVDALSMALLRFDSAASGDFGSEMVQKLLGKHGTFGTIAGSRGSGDRW